MYFARVVGTRFDAAETYFYVFNARFVRGQRHVRVQNGTVRGRDAFGATKCEIYNILSANVDPIGICWSWVYVMYF